MNAQSDPRVCPYVGLEPFEATHADYFFGRRQESRIIADHVRARPITVLYGASGVGKSSVLNVGVQTAMGLGSNWTIVRIRDWQDPERLERIAVDAVLRQLPRQPRRAADRLGFEPLIAWAARTTGRPLLLILDQFEEYFLYRDRERMRRFEMAMSNLLARRSLRLHVLVGIRDDALHYLDELRAFVPAILETTIKLGHLSDVGIEEAIRGPIKQYNADFRKNGPAVQIENSLVKTLVRQLREPEMGLSSHVAPGERQIELPYLQLAMTKIWEAERGPAAAVLRESTLVNRLGGVGQIVRDHVNGVMETLNAKEQYLCSRMFDRLVTAIGGKIAYPTAALATVDVVGPNVSQNEVNAVLNKLTPKGARILKPISINGLEGFEIFHDVLGLPVLEWKRSFEVKGKEVVLRRQLQWVAGLLLLLSLAVVAYSWNNQKITSVENNTAWALTNFRTFPDVGAISAIAATRGQRNILWGKPRVSPTHTLANIVAALPERTVSSHLMPGESSGFFVPGLKKFVFWSSTEGIEIVNLDDAQRSKIPLNNLIDESQRSSRVGLENVAEGTAGTLLLRLSVGSDRQILKVIRDSEVVATHDTGYFVNMSKYAKDAQQGRQWRLYTDRGVVYLFDYHRDSLAAEAFFMDKAGELNNWKEGLGWIDYTDQGITINSLSSFPQGMMVVRAYFLNDNRSVEGVKFLAGGLKDVIAFDLQHWGERVWSLRSLTATPGDKLSVASRCLNKPSADGCIFTRQDHESTGGLLAIQVPKDTPNTDARDIAQRARDLADLVVIDVTTGKTREIGWGRVLNSAKDAELGPGGDQSTNQITQNLSVGGTIDSLIVTVPNGRVFDVFSIKGSIPSYIGTYTAPDLNGVLYFDSSRDRSVMILVNGQEAKIWDITTDMTETAKSLEGKSFSELFQLACKIIPPNDVLKNDWVLSMRHDDLPQIPCDAPQAAMPAAAPSGVGPIARPGTTSYWR